MKKRTFKATAAALAAILTISCAASVFAAIPDDGSTNAEDLASATGLTEQWEDWKTSWETVKNDWSKVSIAPGADETKLNFAWYSLDKTVKFEVSANADMSSPVHSETIEGEEDEILYQALISANYYACKATVEDLEAGVYYYKIGDADPVEFTVQDSTKGFSFMFVGDPQIGSSNPLKGSKVGNGVTAEEFYEAQSDAVMSDSFNWSNTINKALENSQDISFILSAGDQIQSRTKDAPKEKEDNTFSEIEYTGFLSPSALTSIPFAPTVGNHEADIANYGYHFNTPNLSELGSNGIVGGDYYFTYGDALFIVLNLQDTDNEEHKQFIEETVAENSDATWKFVTIHQDIYGSAEHSNEPTITDLRYDLVPTFEENDIDVVFSGHDHAYSRSYILNGGKKTNNYYDDNEDEFDDMHEYDVDGGEKGESVFTAYKMIQDDTTDEKEIAYLDYLNAISDALAVVSSESDKVVNPEGILYMTGNSSSGSKYYDLVSRQQDYISSRWQEDVPTYSLVDITDTAFTINTYRADTNEKIDTEFTIVKGEDDNNDSGSDSESSSDTDSESSSDIDNSSESESSSESSSNADSSSKSSNSSSKSSSNNSDSNPTTGVKTAMTAGLLSVAAGFAAVCMKKRNKK